MARHDDDHITTERPHHWPERDDEDRRPERYDEVRLPTPVSHAGMGVASFVIALLSGLAAIVSIATAIVIGIKNGPIPKDDPAALLIGLGIIGSGILSLIGLVLGFSGMFQSNRRIVFAVLGAVLNLLIVFGICGVVGLGLAIGGH